MHERAVGTQVEETADKRGLAAAVDTAPAVSAWERLASWFALLDRPLTSYYLIIGITALLLGLGLVMVLSTSSVQDLSEGLPAYSDFKKQLLGAAIGLPIMYIAARSPRRACSAPRRTRCSARRSSASGSPSSPGSGWPRTAPPAGSSSARSRPSRPSWPRSPWCCGAPTCSPARSGSASWRDWRHLLVPLLPGVGLLAMLVMVGDDLGTTFVLLVIFITLVWVIGAPGRIFAGMMALGYASSWVAVSP